jgi:Domain of unknown function (DUF1929)
MVVCVSLLGWAITRPLLLARPPVKPVCCPASMRSKCICKRPAHPAALALIPPCASFAEMWDPASETWTTLAAMTVPRTYHSVALLLTDGRVFTGGGGLCGGKCTVNHLNAQIYSPPYLFGADGAPAPRPTIAVSTAQPVWGGLIVVSATSPLSVISMIRYGTVTHALNTDQRRVELCGPATTACAPCTRRFCLRQLRDGRTSAYGVYIPADSGIAIEGNWMVFGVDAAGVPSVSKTVHLGMAAGAATVKATMTEATAADPKPPLSLGNGLESLPILR